MRVIKPAKIIDGGVLKYDYSTYKKISNNYLIPLEIIYRNSLPKGSRFLEDLSEGKLALKIWG